MSISRSFFRELRPLFRMLEEPFGRPAAVGPSLQRSLLDDPFFRSPALLQPAVDVTEEGNKYVIEAELPGVKKENIQVRVGDGGRSLTIEGKVVSRRSEPEEASQPVGAATGSQSATDGEEATAVATKAQSTQLSTERYFSGTSSFSRTVFLPRPIDSSNVSAKLNDGVLTVTVPQAEDKGSVQIPVE
ncbi:HSP20-like chaperone [Laetiporus sulphureus 93-53]|uniref:HSP20-like chaperone n=1 Tax=Laetiporus sulphureus 93-53 TaxID=1314785 RepID=A0A165HPU2_9APHY|nr:HSP20-like chaperone [Laetiporus sulphureus 93-53]KZT12023.1 HSP20-like chaperone [Laetiporus sulphureus 93-53]